MRSVHLPPVSHRGIATVEASPREHTVGPSNLVGGDETSSLQAHFRPVFIGESPGKRILPAMTSRTCTSSAASSSDPWSETRTSLRAASVWMRSRVLVMSVVGDQPRDVTAAVPGARPSRVRSKIRSRSTSANSDERDHDLRPTRQQGPHWWLLSTLRVIPPPWPDGHE